MKDSNLVKDFTADNLLFEFSKIKIQISHEEMTG